ncbi:docking protein 1-like isoform X2 [Gouania willdenowi]|uniref:Docking protein 1-like n=1 Tax=Gouania willdenowi TaxID=441366 RepID=A0A8C5D6Z1_GOUWI|nr:docking protein 1-like isoform X2 [Gouania willdenowi]
METPTKTGTVYLQPHRQGKKWKPVCLSVFSRAEPRLEIQPISGGAARGNHGNRRHHQTVMEKKMKVVLLSELINVLRLPPNAEACPMDNMSAFCVQTEDRTMVFAALKDDCVDWVDKLSQSCCQKPGGSMKPLMEENQIYVSTDEVPGFWIVVQRTEAAVHCGLQGAYLLEVGPEALMLRERHKKSVVRAWPYELLRRYGTDKLALTIEAGRRCDSGPGTFIFQTRQAENIFSLIQSSIKRKSLPTAPGQSEAEATQNKSSLLVDDVQDCVSLGAPPAPITFMPLPSVPTQKKSSADQTQSRSDVIYDEPMECLKSVRSTTALYVDPASILPLKPPCSAITQPGPKTMKDSEDSEYSEVFDCVKEKVVQSDEQKTCFTDEPIYAEPTCSKKKEEKREATPDPFSHLYAQVCKSRSMECSSAPNSEQSTVTSTYDGSTGDVIYENLGII